MKLIYTNENMMLVHSAKNILEMNNIDCMLKNEHAATMGFEFGITNWLELWVKKSDDYAKAIAIVEAKILNQKKQQPWSCKNCHEENEGNFEICWSCQTEHEIVG